MNDREYERLLEACRDLPAPRGFQARFLCLLGGRLGLRAGEIAHFQTAWIDWNRKLIRIPKHEPCDCGCCQRQTRQEAAHTDDLTAEAALHSRWHPKTVASARSIPFDLSLRIELSVERFANRYEEFPRSLSTVTGVSKRPPSRLISLAGCIHIVCAQLPPVTTPTRGWRRYRYKR